MNEKNIRGTVAMTTPSVPAFVLKCMCAGTGQPNRPNGTFGGPLDYGWSGQWKRTCPRHTFNQRPGVPRLIASDLDPVSWCSSAGGFRNVCGRSCARKVILLVRVTVTGSYGSGDWSCAAAVYQSSSKIGSPQGGGGQLYSGI